MNDPRQPHTLSRQQFHQERPHGSYNAYQRYVASKRAQRTAAAARPIDPFAPVSEQQIAQRANVFGPTMSDQQIQQTAGREARAQLDPVLSGIEAEITRRSDAEQQHLAGATQNYQQQVAQFNPQVQQAYGQAEQSQASVNAALQQALAGGGQQLGNELSAKLGAINAPNAQAAGATQAQIGQGAGNAQFASGSAELSRLLAGGASAQEYGAKLPGIAAAEGLQRSGEIAGRYAEENRQRNEQVLSQLPGLTQGLSGSLMSRDEGRRQNRASSIDSERNRALQAGIAQQSGLVDRSRARANVAGARLDQRKQREAERQHRTSERMAAEALGLNVAEYRHKVAHDTTTERQDAKKLGISVADLRERKRSNQARETHQQAQEKQAVTEAEAKGRKVDSAASKARGILVDQQGRPIMRYQVKNHKRVKGTGRTIPYKGGGKSSGSSKPDWGN